MSRPPQPTLLRPREVQALLDLDCVETVWRMIRRGELPATKIGRWWRVRPEDVDAYLAGRSTADSELDAYVERLVDAAPRLSPSQREKLAELLRPARQTGAFG